MCITVAENGELNEENINKAGVSAEEVMNIIGRNGRRLADIRLATINEAGRIDVFD